MATWYTDVATNQQLNVNWPGAPGVGELTTQPGTMNNPVLEGPPDVVATYMWTGNEAANDVINICVGPAGVCVSPNGHVSSGLTAISNTMTLAIGDNDLSVSTSLPVPNPQSINPAASPADVAPAWVSGTSYAAGNVVYDPNSSPANLRYTAVAATTGSTAPHSAANTVWMPNLQRYSNSIDCHAASGNVAFAGGTQLYGGAASVLPNSVVPNSVPSNLTTLQLLNQPYVIQKDCWIQAFILTLNTVALNANSVSIFRFTMTAPN
jgi:hypothetical protein